MPLKNYRFGQKKFGQEELNQLSILFTICDRSDLKQFSNYLKSPFFGVDEESIMLFDFLKKQHKRKIGNTNVKSLLNNLKKVEVTTKEVESYFKKKTRHLYRYFLDFLAHQKLKNDKTFKLQVLQRRLQNQGASVAFLETSHDLHQLHKNTPPGLDTLFDSLQANHLAYYDSSTNHLDKGFKLISSLQNQLEYFYSTAKLAYECEVKNLEITFSKLGIEAEQIKVQERPEIDILQLFELYLAIFDGPDSFSTLNFELFSKSFFEVHNDIDPVLRLILCKHVINVLANPVNKGEDQLKFELLTWLKRRVDWRPLSVKHIDENEFLNLIVVSCHCDEIDYARQFAKENASFLPEADSILAPRLGEAFCFFREKKYSQTRRILNDNFDRFASSKYSYASRSKVLLIRACLADELIGNDGYDEFLRIKDDLRKYVSRLSKDLPPEKVEGYKNFLSIVNMIFLLQKNRNTYSRKYYQELLEKLKLEVSNTSPLIAKTWLIETVDIYF